MACIAFTCIGIPLGIAAHRRETSAGFAISLIVAFSYFFFIVLAHAFYETPEAHPTLLIWLPNLLCMALGGVLFYRLKLR
jgi:lipopolysaccharide export system permease protein